MSLHVKHRPQSFEGFIGNESMVESLKNVLERKDPPHSYLFTGPPGTGKTTLARIIKNSLGIDNSSFYEYNTANTRGIDTIRDIAENCQYRGLGESGKKLFLLDEFHRSTIDAMNSLLKLLEEPPNHVYFVLCTAEIETVKPTIKNAVKRRCHEYELSPLKPNETIQLLKGVLRKEAVDFQNRTNILKKIAISSEGRAGVALKLLDMVLEVTNEEKAIKIIEKAVVTESTVIELCRLLNDTKTANTAKWPKIQKMLKDLKEANDAESIRYAILGYFNSCLLGNIWSGRHAKLITYFSESFMYSGWAALTAACYFINFAENQDDVPY